MVNHQNMKIIIVLPIYFQLLREKKYRIKVILHKIFFFLTLFLNPLEKGEKEGKKYSYHKRFTFLSNIGEDTKKEIMSHLFDRKKSLIAS